MAVWKKLLCAGGEQPTTVQYKDQNGNLTPVKCVKGPDNSIVWGKYNVYTTEELQDFASDYCSLFELAFVNPTYGRNTGEPVAYNSNLWSYRPILLGATNTGYHGEELACIYDLKAMYYTGQTLPGGEWKTGFESGKTWTSSSGTIQDYYTTLTNDLILDHDDSEWPYCDYAPKWGKLKSSKTINPSGTSIPTGGALTVSRTKSPYGGATVSKVNSGNYVYYGDELRITFTSDTLQTGKVPAKNKDYSIVLDGLTSGKNLPASPAAYLTKSNQDVAIPDAVLTLTPPIYIEATRSGDATNGYLYSGTIYKHPLLAGHKIPICLSTNKGSTNPNFSISGGSSIYDAYTSGESGTYKYWSGNWTDIKPNTVALTGSVGNPYKLAATGASLTQSTLTFTRPATYSMFVMNGSGQQVAQMKPAGTCAYYLTYLHDGQFYKISCLASHTSASISNSQSNPTPTVTWNVNPEVNIDDNEDLISNFGQLTIKTPAGSIFKGDIEYEIELTTMDSNYSTVSNYYYEGSSGFSDSSVGITIGPNNWVPINGDPTDINGGYYTVTVYYTLYIGDQSYYGEITTGAFDVPFSL